MSPELIMGLLGLLIGGSGMGGLWLALRKLPVEKQSAEAAAAASLTTAAQGLIDNLQEELCSLRERIRQLETVQARHTQELRASGELVARLQERVRHLEAENRRLVAENATLREVLRRHGIEM